jgi:hypothetical protein
MIGYAPVVVGQKYPLLNILLGKRNISEDIRAGASITGTQRLLSSVLVGVAKRCPNMTIVVVRRDSNMGITLKE